MLPFIEESDSVSEAIETNRDMALNLAVLMLLNQVKPVHLMDLYNELCYFSYRGDIRMKFKAENPRKVKNIVVGSYEGLNRLYMPRLLKLEREGIVQKIGEDEYKMKPSNNVFEYLYQRIPQHIKTGLRESSNNLSLVET